MGLLYLGKILEKDGNNVSILDFSAEKYETQKIHSALNSVDAIGITVISGAEKNTKEVINLVKEKDSDVPIIVGGSHCTIFPKKALNETGADICVQGDGEKVILEIKKALKGQKELSEISGVFFKKQNTIKQGKPYEPITDLDSVLFPARHLVKKYAYGRIYNPLLKKGEYTTISTGRGCPYNCKFCAQNAANLKKFRKRSAENILNEIREINKTGYNHLGIMEDSFLLDKKQGHTIFDKIIKENIDLKFYLTSTNVNSADKELYIKMKKAGVVRIHFDIISGDENILNYYNTKTTVEKIRYAVNLSHDAGFFTSGAFILGAPMENHKQINNTVSFAKSLPLDSVSFIPLRYIAGSELWNKSVEGGKISQDDYIVPADSLRNLNSFKPGEINRYCKKFQQLINLKPKYFINVLKYFLSSR